MTDLVRSIAKSKIPLEFGLFDTQIFELTSPTREVVVLSIGDLKNLESTPFVRIHSECFTGEVLSSKKCDCKFQLDFALEQMAAEKLGVLIYLRQEGRGIGLANKIRCYALQEQGLNTIEANEALGFPADARDFSDAFLVLNALGINRLRLNTNNPDKIKALVDKGIEIADVVPSLSPLNAHNQDYLRVKFHKMGHQLERLFF